ILTARSVSNVVLVRGGASCMFSGPSLTAGVLKPRNGVKIWMIHCLGLCLAPIGLRTAMDLGGDLFLSSTAPRSPSDKGNKVTAKTVSRESRRLGGSQSFIPMIGTVQGKIWNFW